MTGRGWLEEKYNQIKPTHCARHISFIVLLQGEKSPILGDRLMQNKKNITKAIQGGTLAGVNAGIVPGNPI